MLDSQFAAAEIFMSEVKNILLVHGFWMDDSCYSEIIPTLLAEGYKVTNQSVK
jgi:G:T-mismatch repair DNA endonuclease (very short patch repair protein)